MHAKPHFYITLLLKIHCHRIIWEIRVGERRLLKPGTLQMPLEEPDYKKYINKCD
jgi:hypothetical protein